LFEGKESPQCGGKVRILAAKRVGASRRRCKWGQGSRREGPNGKPGQEPEAACRAGRSDPMSLPSGFATRTWCPRCAGSKDCFLEEAGAATERGPTGWCPIARAPSS